MTYNAHDDRKIGKRVVEATVGGLRDKIYIFLEQYRKTGNEEFIREILTLPERRRSVVNNIIANGSQASLVALINAYGTVTAADFDEELTRLENQALGLKAQLDSGATFESIADIIEDNLVPGPLQKMNDLLQYEPNFIDMFGRNRRPM